LTKEQIGIISGLFVVVGFIPYLIRVLQGKITHNSLTSWFLWGAIGFALLTTYDATGAKSNIWPAWGVFLDPTIIAIILIAKRNGKMGKLSMIDWVCILLCLTSLVGLCWFKVNAKDSRELAAYALYLAILADACAAVPIIIEAWNDPLHDRPFAWLMLVTGYFIDLFALPNSNFESYILPVSTCILIKMSMASFTLCQLTTIELLWYNPYRLAHLLIIKTFVHKQIKTVLYGRLQGMGSSGIPSPILRYRHNDRR
jgi:hypothetical protein